MLEKNVININDFDWNNHNILSRNRKASRVHFYPYHDKTSALTYNKDKSSRIKLLNGSWDFKWLESPHLVNKSVFNDYSSYTVIDVPKNWQFDGFGKFVYTDMWYDFPVDAPFVSGNNNETGIYHKTIVVDKIKDSLSIRFEGVESAFHLYVNGTLIGYSQGSRYPSEFDITEAICIGNNDIHVIVYQYCDGSYLEAQDMWWLGGIIRDIYLIERNEMTIENLILDPDYDSETQCGYLNTKITIKGNGNLSCKVYDDNRLLHNIETINLNGQVELRQLSSWTAETPKLYTLIFELTDTKGIVQEVVSQRLGFRHIEIKNGVLLLNGEKILLKGINRHEYSATSGRAITYEETVKDLKLIKDHNMNAIRTSHYPNNPFFYDICNEIGLYVIDEADVESHGLEAVNTDTLLCGDAAYESIFIDRIERMVQRDRNQACIVIWSLGNESAYGVNFKAMYDWCKKHEPTRPVHYEGDYLNESVDVTSTMYSTLEKLYELDTIDIKKPHILCEFGHAMGNGPGSLKEYFELVEKSNRIQGLFVWEFKDQGVAQVDASGIKRYMFGGEFGEDFHNDNFCMDGMVMANGCPTPALKEYAKVIENLHIVQWSLDQKQILVRNRFDFLTTKNIQVTYRLYNDIEELQVITIPMNTIQPREIAAIDIPNELFDYNVQEQVYLQVSFSFIHKMSGFNERFVIGDERIVMNTPVIDSIIIKEALVVKEVGECLVITGELFEVKISKRDGYIKDFVFENMTYLEKGPEANFYRAYTDNDVNNAEKWPDYHLHAMEMNVYHMDYQQFDHQVLVKIKGRVGARGLNWGCKSTLVYHISKDGYIKMDWQGSFDGSAPKQLPKIGLQMQLPKDLGDVVYEGQGPHECYLDSKVNTFFGVHNMNYTDMFFDYLVPQENGNRTGVTWASLSNGKRGIQFASEQMDFSVRDVSDKELNRAKHSVDLVRISNLIVNCDMINSGLGSESCGPDRMNQYKAFTKDFEFQLVIKPLTLEVTQNSDQGLDSEVSYEESALRNIIHEARKLLIYKISE